MVILMITNWAYLFCCWPLRLDYSTLIMVGVTPMIEGGSLLSYQDVSRVFSSPNLPRDFEAIMTGCLGVLLYGVAALCLTLRSFVSFDVKIDRPYRGWDRAFGPGKEVEKEIDRDEEAG
jgi:hypothetical protein